MKMWKIDLTLEQEKRLKEYYFKTTWSKYKNDDACLDLKDTYRFLSDLMQKGKVEHSHKEIEQEKKRETPEDDKTVSMFEYAVS